MSAIFERAARQWQEMHHAYLLARRAQIDEAERVTRGNLINEEGRRRFVSVYDLFSGNQTYARKYASPELIEFWHDHPRLTLMAFEQQWLGALYEGE